MIARYELFLIDAYGVLVTSRGPVDGSRALLRRLRDAGKDLLIVTNDASRLPETCRAHYATHGLDVPRDVIFTSGMLLDGYFEQHQLRGAPTMVLGTGDSRAYVSRAGGEVIDIEADADCEVVVVGDESGYEFLTSVDAVLSVLFRKFSRDEDVRMVLPNPDLVYPKGGGEFGFTSGTVAKMFEDALEMRFPGRRLRFDRLGKPHTFIFEQALAGRAVEPRDAVMIGDQLATDIKGARAAGIDSVLAGTGLSDLEDDESDQPDFVLPSLD